MSQQNILCRNRVWPNGEVLCYDIAILCRDIVGQAGKISVAFEYFYVKIALAMTESSASQDRAGRTKAGTHDSVALYCVVTEEAIRVQ